MAKTKKRERIRFYRGENPTVVWNPKTNTELCRFDQGTLIVEDPGVIEYLRSLGYQEVALDATAPPPQPPPPVQPPGMEDVKTLPKGITLKGAAALQAEDEDGPAVEAPVIPPQVDALEEEKPAAKPKNTPSKKPKKTVVKKVTKKRPIKRRDK